MTDLDTHTLRRALRAPQEPGYPAPGLAGPADVAQIISRGRRLRWRRRAMAAGGSVCLAAAVVGAVAGIGRLTTPSPGPAQHVVSPVGSTRATPPPSPSPHRGRATPSPIPSATAAATPSATPTGLPTAATTSGPTPTTPTPTRSAGATVSPGSGVSATSTPSASASVSVSVSAPSTQGGQPSAGATPSRTSSTVG
jgi:hypothetical protein